MLEVLDIYKVYEGAPLLRQVSFTVAQGETACLLGPSGSGKSTLLRIVAGLEMPDSGRVLWEGHDLASTPSHRRDFGLVFQDYALFPHLNVFENIAFGLRMKKWPHHALEARVREVLEMVNLTGFAARGVNELSGGEQQRVALARALAPRPRLLMFDEPLGALDRALRQELLEELRRILRRTGIPAIYVTHDQEEAFAIADRVLLLHEGQIVRNGSPAEVWENPGSAWAAGFLGVGSVLRGKITGGGWVVQTASGRFTVRCGHKHRAGDAVHLLARPQPVRDGHSLRGRVVDVVLQQGRFKVTLENGLYFYSESRPKAGQIVQTRLEIECLG